MPAARVNALWGKALRAPAPNSGHGGPKDFRRTSVCCLAHGHAPVFSPRGHTPCAPGQSRNVLRGFVEGRVEVTDLASSSERGSPSRGEAEGCCSGALGSPAQSAFLSL